MKNKIVLLVIMLATIVYLSSCSKEDEIINTKKVESSDTYSKARLNNKLSNEEMEANIRKFIVKLENPGSYSAMNFEEAFEYVEATLN